LSGRRLMMQRALAHFAEEGRGDCVVPESALARPHYPDNLSDYLACEERGAAGRERGERLFNQRDVEGSKPALPQL
jgi:hypothetical protein